MLFAALILFFPPLPILEKYFYHIASRKVACDDWEALGGSQAGWNSHGEYMRGVQGLRRGSAHQRLAAISVDLASSFLVNCRDLSSESSLLLSGLRV